MREKASDTNLIDISLGTAVVPRVPRNGILRQEVYLNRFHFLLGLLLTLGQEDAAFLETSRHEAIHCSVPLADAQPVKIPRKVRKA